MSGSRHPGNPPPALPDGRVAATVRPRRRRIAWGLAAVAVIVLVAWLTNAPTVLLKIQAQRQLQRGRPYQALAWLAWAGKLTRSDAELEFLNARACRIQGEMNQARTHLERAWQLGYPVKSLEREQTLALAQSGQFHEVESALATLLTDPRGDSDAICEAFVMGYIRTYRIKQAELLLKAWLADSPRQPRALFLRAKVQVEQFNWKGAEEDLRGVLAAVPEHASAADLLAGVLLKLKQPRAALDVLPVALKDPETRLSARLREVECLRIQGEPDVVRQLLQSILKEYPDSMEALLDLGSLESEAGNFEAALVWLQQAVKLAPQSPDVRYALAIALRGAGRTQEAKEHFDYVTRARDALTQVLELRDKLDGKPADGPLRCRIGATLLEYGQPERGLVWLQSALDVNPRLTEAHQRLAEYYESRAQESEVFAKMALEHRRMSSPQ